MSDNNKAKPSEEFIAGFASDPNMQFFVPNLANISEDFGSRFTFDPATQSQTQIDMAFLVFLWGMINVMNPESKFNKGYQHAGT